MLKEYTEKYSKDYRVIVLRHSTGRYEVWHEIGFRKYVFLAESESFEELKKQVDNPDWGVINCTD